MSLFVSRKSARTGHIAKLSASIAAGALALACASSLAQAPETIRVAINSDIRSMNPGVNRDSNTDGVVLHMVEGLVAYGEDGAPRPMLAEHVRTSEDGRTVTFELRRGVKFHNGAVMTSADVVWSWRRYLDPKTNWVCLPDLDGSRGVKIESVEAVDADTVVFHLDRPHPMLLSQMASVQCGAGAILHRDSVDADGTFKTPIATGPYRFGSWRRGQYIELVAFQDYRPLDGKRDGYAGGKVAYADKVRWLVIRDDAARRAALIKGQVEVLPWLSVPELAELRKYPDIAIENAPTLSANVLLIQTKDPLLSNALLRRALAHSLDFRAITEVVSGGIGTQDASMVPVVSPYHSAAHEQGYRYDPQLARRLLAQAGYQGQKIKLITNRRYADLFDQSIMIQSMARQAGINVELVVLEWTTQLDRYQSGNYQLMSFAYSPRVDPCLSYDAMLGNRNKSTRKVWDNPQALRLLAAACGNTDPATRQAHFDRLHALMLRDVPLIVLFNPGAATAVSKRLKGYESWPLTRERLWNVQPTTVR